MSSKAQSSDAKKTPTTEAPKETLEDIYRKDAETDRKDALYEAEMMDLLKRKEAPAVSMREKVEGTKAFARMLAEPSNSQTARVFVLTSFAMFTLPLIVFFISVAFIEPMVGSSDPDTFNALAAVATTIAIVIAYIIYAFKSDALDEGKLDYPHLSGLQGKKAAGAAAPSSAKGGKKTKKD